MGVCTKLAYPRCFPLDSEDRIETISVESERSMSLGNWSENESRLLRPYRNEHIVSILVNQPRAGQLEEEGCSRLTVNKKRKSQLQTVISADFDEVLIGHLNLLDSTIELYTVFLRVFRSRFLA